MSKKNKDTYYFSIPTNPNYKPAPFPIDYQRIGGDKLRYKPSIKVKLTDAVCKECGSPGYKLEKVKEKPQVRLTSCTCKSCGSPGYKIESVPKPDIQAKRAAAQAKGVEARTRRLELLASEAKQASRRASDEAYAQELAARTARAKANEAISKAIEAEKLALAARVINPVAPSYKADIKSAYEKAKPATASYSTGNKCNCYFCREARK